MSYITDKFENGEVVIKDFVCGWEFEKGFHGTYEHRPLMADAMSELLEAGLITQQHVDATEAAREVSNKLAIEAYIKAQANRTPEQIAEERFEARAAVGPGEKIVNVFTGERFCT